jgi:hypothetical protein
MARTEISEEERDGEMCKSSEEKAYLGQRWEGWWCHIFDFCFL